MSFLKRWFKETLSMYIAFPRAAVHFPSGLSRTLETLIKISNCIYVKIWSFDSYLIFIFKFGMAYKWFHQHNFKCFQSHISSSNLTTNPIQINIFICINTSNSNISKIILTLFFLFWWWRLSRCIFMFEVFL